MISKSCLIHHPDTADSAIKALYIGVKAQYQNGNLTLRYEVQGNIDKLLIPGIQPPSEADGLWQHTCFEAFIAVVEEAPYREFNFSPSGQWAAYSFGDYRVQKKWQASPAPAIHFARSNHQLVLTAVISETNLPYNPHNQPYRLGLTAVLETNAGEHSYWALFHPSGKPDFHHRNGFTLSLKLT
ncbi:hypothetical protein MGMO_143c00130 [Methyloglobulus morosus KoM1]|uniref:DOMON-like domain-containing protein n=1 Tax=Methyloglobulus morosus KoM1 TaxID=1116472 RepID=V5BRL0_9GAMM|nr:DOMON-like domain-containing protein [Methyloglobulus morosus]ESS68812.1 hypothetical protein MGMO_143c00130 [Methyloglobulus morosus KoM1]